MAVRRVVITGLGIISPIGIGKEAFYEGLFKGVSGIKPITLFDTFAYKVKTAGEVTEFSAESFLGAKGLRTLDRSTRLVSSATKLALDDANIQISEGNARDIAVSVGSTLGSIKSISDFDREALTEGSRYVNPALFPNTVINSAASQVSIRFNIRGFNATISSGFSASLDAVNYAADFLRLGRIKIVLAGGVEELCEQLFIAFYKTGCLAGVKDASAELSCPFDLRRNGIILGEGSVILVLEDLDSALSRGAKIYAQIKGFSTGLDKKKGLIRAMQEALKKSQLSPSDIDLICAGANSSQEGDREEARAIKDVFEKDAERVYISAIKSLTGEQYSNSGALQAAAAVAAIEKEMIPPTVNYQERDAACDLRIVTEAHRSKVKNVLINAYGKGGCSSSLVISKFEG
jgi:3-oxoacyl-[acyl-carrier-protein] synthase II